MLTKTKERRPLFDTVDAAIYIDARPNYLEKLRCNGGGPVFIKHRGLVRYDPDDLDAWLNACKRRSTSDAVARGTKPSEWTRQAIRTALQLDGFDPATIAPRDAGTLYDVLDGKQRWARIEGDQIKGMTYHDGKPDDRVWVPVLHEDSEPFDAACHWRLPPHYALVSECGTPDRVICAYPVVPKSLEHA
jgi:hypothetical protein